MPEQIVKANLLIVEGDDEENLCSVLIDNLRIQNIQIFNIKGINNLRPSLKTIAITPLAPSVTHINSIGIITDADTNPAISFQRIRDSLRDAKLPVPEAPSVSTGLNPSVTVMLLPNNTTPGMIEDLCLSAVSEDRAMICVERYVRCLREQGIDSPSNIAKARIQVFLASRPLVVKSLGIAAKKGYLPLGNEIFQPLRSFLTGIAS